MTNVYFCSILDLTFKTSSQRIDALYAPSTMFLLQKKCESVKSKKELSSAMPQLISRFICKTTINQITIMVFFSTTINLKIKPYKRSNCKYLVP